MSFQREISGGISPYWEFYDISSIITGYKNNELIININDVNDAMIYLSNEDISSITGNNYGFTITTDKINRFYLDGIYNQPLFAVYKDTYYYITNDNIYSAVNKWRYDKFDALALYGPISTWTISGVTDMSGLFKSYDDFNDDISGWNVSTVTNMNSMFYGASTFNQHLGKWNISDVTDMSGMFYGAYTFNQSLYNWNIDFFDVSDFNPTKTGVTLTNMLYGTTNLKYYILNGDVSNDNIYEAVQLYKNPIEYNYIYKPITQWNTTSIIDMSGLFKDYIEFNEDISGWNTGQVTNMSELFKSSGFNYSISKWNTSNVITMQSMFENSPYDEDLFGTNHLQDGLFNIVVLRRITSTTHIYLRELQIWINNKNILPANTNDSVESGPIGDTIEFIDWETKLVTGYIASNIANNSIIVDVDSVNNTSSLYIPITRNFNIQDIQSIILYNSDYPHTYKILGFDIEFYYSSLTSVVLENPIYSIQIPPNTYQNIYRWNFPRINTYNLGFSTSDSITQIKNMSPITTIDIHYFNTSNVITMEAMFKDSSFNKPIDDFNTAKVTSMNSMFYNTSFDNQISSWDVSAVTDMSYMFYGAQSFNGDISGWNTGKVTTMNSMFYNATLFDSQIGKWNTIQVTDIYGMFYGATTFNQSINDWNTTHVTTMNSTFYNAVAFDKPLYNWDTSMVTDMSGMFNGAQSFHQDLSSWNVEYVTNMNSMFNGATSFNYELDMWDVSNVIHMDYMFKNATAFNQSLYLWIRDYNLNISTDSTNVEDVSVNTLTIIKNNINVTDMFLNAYSIEYLFLVGILITNENINYLAKQWVNNYDDFKLTILPIDRWFTNKVTDMSGLFVDANFNDDISGWLTNNVTNMDYMFMNSTFNSPIYTWNTSKVTSMKHMFDGADKFDQSLNEWDVSIVTDMAYMFNGASEFDQSLNDWNVSNVTYMNNMFNNATIFNQPLYNWDISNVIQMESMFNSAITFNQSLYNWDNCYGIIFTEGKFANKTGVNTDNMFDNTPGLNFYILNGNVLQETIYDVIDIFINDLPYYNKIHRPIGELDTSQLTDISRLFEDTSFNSYIGNWNVSNVTNMYSLFQNNASYNQSLSKWDVSNVTDMESMFNNATSFNRSLINWTKLYNIQFINDSGTITAYKDLILTDFMFYGASSLEYVVLTGNVSNNTIHQIVREFDICYTEALIEYKDFPNWDTSIITDMSGLFKDYKTFNIDISSWDVSAVTTMHSMFEGAESFNQYIGNWDISSVIHISSFLKNAKSFDQDITWNVNNIYNLDEFFSGAERFDKSINYWDISHITSMNAIFKNATEFNQSLTKWRIDSLTNLTEVFAGASNFNQPLHHWNTENIKNMDYMFQNATQFTQDISSWNVSNVTSMHSMFQNCIYMNSFFGRWDVSSTTTMTNMFNGCSSINQSFYGWGYDFNLSGDEIILTKPETETTHIFLNCDNLEFNYANGNVTQQTIHEAYELFKSDPTEYALKHREFSELQTEDVNNLDSFFKDEYDFNENISKWNLSNVTSMKSTFENCISFNQNLNDWIVSKVTSINSIFLGAIKFNGTVNDWDVANIEDCSGAFMNTYSFQQNVYKFNLKKCIDFTNMFNGSAIQAQNLIDISGTFESNNNLYSQLIIYVP